MRWSPHSRTDRGAVVFREGGYIVDHPVLAKPLMLRGVVPLAGSLGCSDLRWASSETRAAMGGEKERAEPVVCEAPLGRSIADALVAQLREEAAAHGLDIWRWLARETGSDDP